MVSISNEKPHETETRLRGVIQDTKLKIYSGPFAIWRFHFPQGADNSGFVGWLATHLKTRIGTGVFVICGQNSNDGGIFDYWGCPWELRDSVLSEVRALVAGNA